jgi:peptide/nickel transport system permease protein/oligopeptide transport system permease protein
MLGVPPQRVDTEAQVSTGQADKAIEGRSLWRISWTRLRRDRVAMAGGIVVIVLILVSVIGPFVLQWLKISPDEFHSDMVDPATLAPVGPFSGMSWHHPFGVQPVNGRDIFARVVYGGRISLLIAGSATLLSVFIGSTLGLIAGFFGGWVDAVIARLMDIFLAFPVLVFALAMIGVIPEEAFGLDAQQLRIALIIFVIGFFNWPYVGRIIRGQTLSIREREFVDAARSLGAKRGYILFREILPNLIAPILIYTTLLIPTNILFEATLSFLGFGIRIPTPSWGEMLANGVNFYNLPFTYIWPGLAIFVTVLSFNLFGDGLRDAFDPKSR